MQFQTGSDLRRSSAAESGVGEAHLQHALERDIRAGQERAVLAIHLSKLLAPGPRPHHRRIAKAIMEEAAQSHSGQVFVRANADVVLLCDPAGTARVQDTLARLFRAEALDPEHLLSAWVLPQDSFALDDYLTRTAAAAALLDDPSTSLSAIGAMDTLLASVRLTDFSRRQLAVQVTPADMIPLYRELTVSMDVVDARSPVAGAVQADPYLFRYLTSQLDPRMMELLAHGMGRPGLMAHTPMPHLNLSVRAILSPGFLHLAEMAEAASVRLGVEVAMVEACADPLAFGAARMVLRAHGCVVVLDGITHQGLLISRPEMLGPDLVKLDWSPRMAQLNARDRRLLTEALQRIGTKRLVLHRAENAVAMEWGARHGISRFQGRHVDALLAARRLADCPEASGCTLGQCLARAAATGASGRVGCRNTPRLDDGPKPVASQAAPQAGPA